MADGLIQLNPDSTGKKVDTSEIAVGANTVERERVVLADDATAAALAKIANANPASTDYALVVRVLPLTGTATNAQVAGSATSVSLRSSTAGRRGLIVNNDSTAILYLTYGATATASAYTAKIPPQGYWEMPAPIYTGAVSGIWSAANGNAVMTELT